MKTIRIILNITLSLLLTTISAHAQNNTTVNVLTWLGYLNEPSTTKLIKDKCGADLSYDSYTSNDDMLRRWNANAGKYDLLIFSYTLYNAIKDDIILNNSELWKKSRNYNKTIRNTYNNRHFPHNIAYFAHSLTGFIWNPDIIHLTKDDTVQAAFKKAKNNKVILLDDPVEINMLFTVAIKKSFDNPDHQILLDHFKKLTQEARIYISNEDIKVYSQKDFAFSYQWLGPAFNRSAKAKHYPFLISEHLSYVSTDLIAQVKDNKIAACVADVLTSKEFLSQLQNRTQYFSPYGNIDAVPEGEFKKTYKKFLGNLLRLHWLEPPPSTQLKKLNQKWDAVKYELTQNR